MVDKTARTWENRNKGDLNGGVELQQLLSGNMRNGGVFLCINDNVSVGHGVRFQEKAETIQCEFDGHGGCRDSQERGLHRKKHVFSEV
jgi:hypothetical protein